MQRLTRTFTECDPSTLDDLLSCIMATIEDGLLQSGFAPGQHYTQKDLLDAAMPFVKSVWDSPKDIAYTTGWPNP